MTTREQHNAAALKSLLPLLESHLDLLNRTVSRAQWVSPPDAARPPQTPEPDCTGRCPVCLDFHTRRCHLREERWAAEWARLRRRYPELVELELAVQALGAEHPHYASALYWVHVQPWDAWNPERRSEWAREGIGWIAERYLGWLPVYVPEGMPAEQPLSVAAAELRADGLSCRQIARRLGVGKSSVHRALADRHGRIPSTGS